MLVGVRLAVREAVVIPTIGPRITRHVRTPTMNTPDFRGIDPHL
jgi:hypothetical protein